jgi:hypothetical protein
MKARTLFDTKHAGDATDYPADHATNDCTDRTSCPLTISRTSLDATRNALGLACNGKTHRDTNSGCSD